MATIKTYDGTEHSVTAAWAAECIEAFPRLAGMTQEEHEILRKGLLDKSNSIPLTEKEEAELGAVTKWQNVNRAWAWLAGRHYNEVGFDYLDQVHGNRVHHACGCQTQHIFDHHKAVAGEDLEHHAHFSKKTCKNHAPLFIDYREHRSRVIADNK